MAAGIKRSIRRGRPSENQVALLEDIPEAGKGNVVVRRAMDMLKQLDRTIALAPNFQLVNTKEQLRMMVAEMYESGIVSIDTETRGLNWLRKKPVSLNVYTPSNDRAYFVPNRMVHATRNFSDAELFECCNEVMADPKVRKIGQNFKFDIHIMREGWGIELAGFYHDTMIGGTVLNENEDHDLESMCLAYGIVKTQWKHKMDEAHFEIWPMRIAQHYACKDAEAAYKLFEFQEHHLKERPKLHSIMYDLEMPIVNTAVDMERRGVATDIPYYEETMKPMIQSAVEEYRSKILAKTGPINLEAPHQVASAFFDMLELPRINGDSTAEASLTELKAQGFEVAGDMLNYRKYATIDKMFVRKLPLHVRNGRIHCTFNTIGAETGRMSCKVPNLQQLPKRIGPVIRRFIIPSPDHVFVAMDYNQLELRLLADRCADEGLIAAFQAGQDIHAAVMCGMLGVNYDDYLADPNRDDFVATRVLAKTVNFGTLYGMGVTKLAWKTGKTKEEAYAFQTQYFGKYPGIKKWKTRTELKACKEGYVETIMGRKRRLPNAMSSNIALAKQAEREAVNSVIQGSAADIVKKATLDQDAMLRVNHWPYKLLLQIHDELLYEVPKIWLEHHQQSLQALVDCMQSTITLLVPLEVKYEVLTRWGDKTELEFEDDDEEILEVA